MTPKQMYRAMRKWGISVVFDRDEHVWCSGAFEHSAGTLLHVEIVNPIVKRGVVTGRVLQHVGPTPEIAVEDYCNARNLEWDV
jgi:hypothetical protein